MEGLQERRKKGSILKKTWERCKSFGPQSHIVQKNNVVTSPLTLPPSSPIHRTMVKSKSWSTFCPPSPLSPRVEKWVGSKSSKGGSISPKGCLSVYVGPDKQRFVIKIECTNHPLFKMLLDEAEMEYGFHSDGPLMLPCEVDMFIKILYEMDENEDYAHNSNNLRCSIPRNRSSYHLLNPSSRLIT